MGVKPFKFPRYKWVCSPCEKEIGGYEKTREWLLPRFKAEGLKADKI